MRHFYNHPTAFLAKAALEVEEIPSYLADEHIVGMNWLWARVVGGIRLVVASESFSRATEVLDRNNEDVLAGIEEWEQPPSRFDACPLCGSSVVISPRWGRNTKALSLWLDPLVFVAVFAVAIERYRCSKCGHSWS